MPEGSGAIYPKLSVEAILTHLGGFQGYIFLHFNADSQIKVKRKTSLCEVKYTDTFLC